MKFGRLQNQINVLACVEASGNLSVLRKVVMYCERGRHGKLKYVNKNPAWSEIF